MTQKQIQAIGNFLEFYETDLLYIREFQNLKTGMVSMESSCLKTPGSFYSFLIEYSIIRNIQKGTCNVLLSETLEWIKTKTSNDVDAFSERLSNNKITNHKKLVSLASKVLFLNNPAQIIPMDSLARNTLKQKVNDYSIYRENLDAFIQKNKTIISECMDFVKPLTDEIHKRFTELEYLESICKNRMIDKILWISGKQ